MTEPKRTKVFDVAAAESLAWQAGIKVACHIKDMFVGQRYQLLQQGFPPGHALCEELDLGAAKWAAHEAQMQRDYAQHCADNQIQS